MIQSIQFEGLKKTKASYLLQFLEFKKGHFFRKENLQKDIQQLWNVGTNYQVDARVDTLPNQNVAITYLLKEKKTLLPVVNLGGIKDNLWFQFGLTDYNGLGLGHQYLLLYQNIDGRHGGQLFYRIPYLNQRWGMALNLLHWRSREPLYFSQGAVDYDYNNTNMGITGIYNFGFRKKLELTASVFQEKYKKSKNQSIENPPGPQNLKEMKFSTKLEYLENNINYYDIYSFGWSWRGIYQLVYNFDDTSIFNSLIFQVRRFYRVGKKGNIAMRARFGLSTNNDSPFAPFVVDSRVNLRGSGNRIERGTGQLIWNAEYRHTVWDNRNWALQVVGFSDLGNWRQPGGRLRQFLDKKELRHFVGGGVRFIRKTIYNAIIRIDYGIDIYDTKQQGIVIGTGQYF